MDQDQRETVMCIAVGVCAGLVLFEIGKQTYNSIISYRNENEENRQQLCALIRRYTKEDEKK